MSTTTSTSGQQTTLLITCGAIAGEILAILKQNALSFMKVECLPAHLHNTPQQIPEAVRAKIRQSRDKFQHLFVLYADCGTGGKLDAVLEEEGVKRIPGAHCYELFAGHDAFADIMNTEVGSFSLPTFWPSTLTAWSGKGWVLIKIQSWSNSTLPITPDCFTWRRVKTRKSTS